ncbi:MAG: hypothetical protein R6U96_14735, partial [Promethearchaeia archaeon]
KTTASKDEDDTSKYDSPRSSTNVNVSTFKINDTKIYRNGTFYLFQNDTLFFSLTDPDLSGIEDYDVNITVEHESEDITIDLDSSDNKEWNATHKFDVATDKCVSYLTYRNNEEVTNFNFNLDINNPSPRIVNVWGQDSNFNPELTPIYEKGIYSTYRGTDFNLTVEVLNKEGGIDNVELDYTDYNETEYTKELGSDGSNPPLYNYSLSKKNEEISIDFSDPNEWKSTTNDDELYEFKLNASDSEGSYVFKFFIEIKNKAPQIDQFDLSKSEETPENYTVTVDANASDHEDDKLYFNNDERTAKYTDPVDEVDNKAGCYIKSGDKSDIQENNSESIDLNFTANEGGELIIHMDVNEEINLDKIDAFQTKVVLEEENFNPENDYPETALLEIYDFDSSSWELLSNLSSVYEKETIANSSANLDNSANPSHYYSPDNKTVKLKISYNDTGDIEPKLYYVDLTTEVKRRETFSRIYLKVYHPSTPTIKELEKWAPENEEDDVETVELINYWDNANGQWSYEHTIDIEESNNGTWMFQLFCMDHGSTDYIDPIWKNFSDSYKFDDNDIIYDEEFGKAYATQIINLGGNTETLNMTGAPQTNSTYGMEPYLDDSFNMSVTVDGYDNTNGDLDHINKTEESFAYSPRIREEDIDGNGTWTTVGPKYNLSGSISNTTTPESDVYSFLLGSNSSHTYESIGMTFDLDDLQKEWLEKDNITEIKVNIDNWFNDTSTIDNVYLEFLNISSLEWINVSDGWVDDNLKTETENEHFEGTILAKSEIEDIVGGGDEIRMRLRIDGQNSTDYNTSIDFVNISVSYKNNYQAWLQMDSFVNEGESFKLTPYKIDSDTMQYSTILNISSAEAEIDRFNLGFMFQNGESRILHEAFRMEPRITDADRVLNQYYSYNPSEENSLNENMTLNIRDEPISLEKDFDIDRFLYIRGRDEKLELSSAEGALNLSSLADHDKLDLRLYVRKGSEKADNYKEYTSDIVDSDTESWAREISFDSGNPFYSEGIFYCFLYIRGPYGQEFSTSLKEFRIINAQPGDFEFKIDDNDIENIDNKSYYRNEDIKIDFSFHDYDMTEEEAKAKISDVVQIRFQLENKTTDTSTWLYADYSSDSFHKNDQRFEYEFELNIPSDITTGEFNKSYYNWEILVNDSNDDVQSQLSFFSYNDTEFIVKNNPPSISNLQTNFTDDQIYRNNEIDLSFNIEDDDALIEPNLLNVTYFNISAPEPDQDEVIEDNTTIKFNGTHRFYNYFAERNASLGIYNISVKIEDSDGRAAYDETHFVVLNNIPEIKRIRYHSNNLTEAYENKSIYRNLDNESKYEPVTFNVTISDVEDSWLDDNRTSEAYLILKHEDSYVDDIEKVSPNLEPIRIDLNNSEAGKDSNGHNETWEGSYQFNNTNNVNGEKLFAGKLEISVYVNDSDGGFTGKRGEEKDHVIIMNHAPQLHNVKLDEFGMEEENTYYYKNEVKIGEDIDVHIFVSDKEGLRFIKLTYKPRIGVNALPEPQEFVYYYEENWTHEVIEGVEVYTITIEADSLPDETVGLEVDKIAVYDTDYSYKPDSKYGKTAETISDFGDNEVIEITGVEVEETEPWVLWILTGIGIVALIGAVIGGIYYYQKKTSWKRFLD